jgi:hypothetical protein
MALKLLSALALCSSAAALPHTAPVMGLAYVSLG